jgi:hypothetical protein
MLAAAASASGQGAKPVTFEDLMRFKAIRTPVVSEDGTLLAYSAQPDRGDEDGPVRWYQSIEMYLAMRRLGKDCILLQYRGEPHHPQKYGNKLDCSIRMTQYFDHYLKGEPAADWIKTGAPYRGK